MQGGHPNPCPSSRASEHLPGCESERRPVLQLPGALQADNRGDGGEDSTALAASVQQEIAPLLDDAMGKLGETDRNVLVLRFFEGRTNAETAAALGLAEGAVQKRVQRALEKLRASFAKQGVTHTAQAIAGTVTSTP